MYNPDYLNWGKQGWICSKCGKSLSPDQFFCPFCSDNRTTIQSDRTTIIPKGWWDDYNKRSTGDIESIVNSWKTFSIVEN